MSVYIHYITQLQLPYVTNQSHLSRVRYRYYGFRGWNRMMREEEKVKKYLSIEQEVGVYEYKSGCYITTQNQTNI